MFLTQGHVESFRREGFKTLDSAVAWLGVERQGVEKFRQRGGLEEFTQTWKAFQRDAGLRGGLSGVYVSVHECLITKTSNPLSMKGGQ